MRGGGGDGRGGGLGSVALVHLPRTTVSTVGRAGTFGNLVVLEDDVLNHRSDLVRADAHSPPLVSHHIIDALVASVAGRLHGIAGKRARSRCSVACADVYGICSVAKVICSRVGSRLRGVGVCPRGDREAQARRRKCFWNSLERHRGQAIGQAEKRRDSTA